MLQFEEERKKERAKKEELKKQINTDKQKSVALNFQQAEIIRQKEKDLAQAQFFYKELRKMQVKESKEKVAIDH